MKLQKNIIIKGKLEVMTGMHIGGNKDTLEIGGIDNPIIKDPEGHPYIPGSSLKGKLRSLIELKEGHIKPTGEHQDCKDEHCPICNVFGRPANSDVKNGPSRLIVRDLHLTEESWNALSENNELVNGTESKTENSINRLTSKATPRTFERAARGSEFNMSMVLSIYEGDNEKEFLKTLGEAMDLLLDNYLGGMGSRGYGKVSFKELTVTEKKPEDYESGTEGNTHELSDISELINSG